LGDPASIDFSKLPQVASEVLSLFYVLAKDRLTNEEIAKELGKEDGNVNKVIRSLIEDKKLLSEEHRGIYTDYFIPTELKGQKFEEKVVDNYLETEWPIGTKIAPHFLSRIVLRAVEVAVSGSNVKASYNSRVPGQLFSHNIDLLLELGSSFDGRVIIPIFVLPVDRNVMDRLFQIGGEYKDMKMENTRGIVIISIGSLTRKQEEYLEYKSWVGGMRYRPFTIVIPLSKGPFSSIVSQVREKLSSWIK